MAYRVCFKCGRNGAGDPLDKHHIFGGAYRAKSEKYGLYVYLCHHDCHIFGENAVHNNSEEMEKLHKYGQRKVMTEQGWTVEQFIAEFGRNYLTIEELADVYAERFGGGSSFRETSGAVSFAEELGMA